MLSNWPKYVFSLLLVSFLGYSMHLYSLKNFTYRNKYDISLAQKGELVWQKYNCQSCHQMYGLGGYLGPDLTNIISSPGKNVTYILAMIQAGTPQMPSFNLNIDEQSELIEFLKSTDASGIADPKSYKPLINGMITKDGN